MATTQAKQALRAARKSQGLCIFCGDSAVTGKTRCQRCTDRDTANRKRWAARDAKRGICCNTGCTNPVTDSKRYCDKCNARSTRNGAKQEQARIAAGLCRDCGKQPVVAGITRCASCNLKMAAGVKRLADKRTAAGLCARCGDHVLEVGYTMCRRCIDYRRAAHRTLKQQVLAAYGGPVCCGCGETEFWVLQIDHVGGGGHAHAKAVGNGDVTRGRSKMYRWLRDNGFPLGFRVLCANCNIKAARGIQLPNANQR